MSFIVEALTFLVYACMIAVFVRALSSWFPINPRNEFMRSLFRFTEPLMTPWRRIIPNVAMFDLSAMAAMLTFIIMLRSLERIPGA